MVHGSGKVITKSRQLPTLTESGHTNKNYNSSDVLQSETSLGTVTTQEGSEFIRYTTKPKSQRLKANQCIHAKASVKLMSPVDAVRLNSISPAGWYTLYKHHHQWSVVSSDIALATFKSALGENLNAAYLGVNGQGLINDAFVATKPDLTSVSVPNFLLELDDIPRLWQMYKRKLSKLKNAANIRLNWSFGWKPLIGDLLAITDVLRNTISRLEEWEKRVGTVYQRSHTIPLSALSASGNFTYPSGLHKVYYQGTVERSCSAYLTYKTLPIAALNGLDKILRAYLDALGFELNPQIVWDAIPFTFVIDWFFDVGGFLSRFKIDSLELPIVLVDSCLQYKESLRMEHYWIRGMDGTYSNTNPRSSVVSTEDFFHRMPIFPDMSIATAHGWKIPKTNQLINLISLGTALKK